MTTPAPTPNRAAQLIEITVPATEEQLAVIRTACTSALQSLQIPRVTLEVLRNAVDSAAVELLYGAPGAHSVHAQIRLEPRQFEVALIPWRGETRPQASPASVDLRASDPASEHVVIEPLLPDGVRVRRVFLGA